MDYDKFISNRVKEIKPSGIRKFFDIAAEMEGVISLSVGEPDFETPQIIRKVAIQSIEKGKTQYTSNQGMVELREAISKYLKRFNLNYDKEEILITVGASEALDISLRAVISDGDEVIIPDPGYVSYEPTILLAGGTPVLVKTYADNGFKLTAKEIEKHITEKTKLIMLPFPSNPTGAILEKSDLEEIALLVEKYNLFVLTDEVYAELTYEGEHIAFASLKNMKDRTLTVNGFSKGFCMTGWRMGYVCGPIEIMNALKKVHQYVIMCSPTMGQYGAIAALEEGFKNDFQSVKEMRMEFDRRRKYIIDRLNAMGLTCHNARGAFYAFPSVKITGLNGDEFAEKFLIQEKVAVVPGSAFGCMVDHVRICYASSMQKLELALDKMEEFTKQLIMQKNK